MEKEKLIENDFSFKEKKTDYFKKSNICSKLFYFWAYKILKIANKTKLNEEDLGIMEEENKAAEQFKWIKNVWNGKKYKQKKKCSIFCTLLRTNLAMLMILQILSIVLAVLEVVNILVFRYFIDLFQNDKKPDLEIFFISGGVFIFLRVLESFLGSQSNFYQTLIGKRSIVQLNALIFEKILVESPSSTKFKTTQGEIINFLQSDSYKINDLFYLSPMIIITPFKLAAFLYLLFYYFGYIFSIGLGVMILLMIINVLIQNRIATYEEDKMKRVDERMKMTTEVINHIKLLKLYSWEDDFLKKILSFREKELNMFWKSNFLMSFVIYFLYASPVFVAVASFTSYQFIIGQLTLINILTLINVFNNLSDLITFFPFFIHISIECKVAFGRIEKYLNQDEIIPARVESNEDKENHIIIENGNFSWGVEKTEEKDEKDKKEDKKIGDDANNINDDVSEITLKTIDCNQSIDTTITNPNIHKKILSNIKLKIKKGELVAIIGEIGSGKSSLLQAILNNLLVVEETEDKKTKIILNGSMSYVSQTSWILNDTLKNNILLFNPNNHANYEKIVDLCELRKDLESLPAGDNTEIGEKGINISGGQKTRISIARATVADSDIYFFDDPISALDAHVGKKIMTNLIVNYLKPKTRVLVTHALQYLSYCDRIIMMKGGQIFWEGDYSNLTRQDFFNDFALKLNRRKSSLEDESVIENIEDKDDLKNVNNKNIARITKDEEQLEGSVSLEVKKKYVKLNGGYFQFFAIILVMLMWQLCRCSSNVLITFWTRLEDMSQNYNYFWFYIVLGIIGTIFVFFRVLMLSIGCYECSKNLHKEIITKIINAPINIYHDTTPKGQILNNLSKDLSTIDDSLMWSYGSVLSVFYSLLGGVVMCAIFMPYSLIIIPFLTYICYLVVRIYIDAGRDLYRLEGIAKSPILNTLSETLAGITTIRAHKYETVLLDKFLDRVENLFKINVFSKASNCWLSLILDLICINNYLFLIILAILFRDTYDAQQIGLILSYSMFIQQSLYWLFQELTSFELCMISLERCLKYENIAQEAPSECIMDNQLTSWPDKGEIQFRNYSVKYRSDCPIILKNLTFFIQAKEKIGVVGRTGSGKSTLCLCIFRILEPLEGQILIDGVDIKSIGLKLLRTKLTIIPQDGMLIEGSLRFNIDPLSFYTESEILSVVNSIGLSSLIQNSKLGLEMIINENGGNLSVGERQLISIARAILRKSKIIIMDEATANIDIKTEEMIQNVINSYLSESTIITIAHRIKTVLKYDKIISINNGEIVEFDTPENLIKNKQSLFYELYSNSLL